MIEVREVLRRFTLGEPVRAIARGTRVDRKTVTKYIAAGVVTGLSRGSTLPGGRDHRGDSAAPHRAAGDAR